MHCNSDEWNNGANNHRKRKEITKITGLDEHKKGAKIKVKKRKRTNWRENVLRKIDEKEIQIRSMALDWTSIVQTRLATLLERFNY